ncbi:MAG: tetratricopeptide repeat protein [Chloroflexi bacterium]|nr:tetratricopeptide repeat protein [Chloroflexota bacterium]
MSTFPVKTLVALCLAYLLSLQLQPIFWRNVGYFYANHALKEEPKNYLLAEKVFRQVLAKNEGDLSTNWGLGQILLAKNNSSAAIEIWRNNPMAYLRLPMYAELAQTQQDWPATQQFYEVLVALEPTNSTYWYLYGRTLQTQQYWLSALTSYDQALQWLPENNFSRSDIYLQQGIIYQLGPPEIRDLPKALELYQQALELNQFSSNNIAAEAWYQLGHLYTWQGQDFSQQLNAFSQALALNSHHQWARLRYAYALYQANHDVTTAKQQIWQVKNAWEQTSNPHIRWCYYYLGDIYFQEESWVEAEIAYQRLLELEPNDQHSQERIAQINQGRINELEE